MSTSRQKPTNLHGGALEGSLRAVIAVVALGVVFIKAENEVLDHRKSNAQMIRGRLGQMHNIRGRQAITYQLPAQGERQRGQGREMTEAGQRLGGGSN